MRHHHWHIRNIVILLGGIILAYLLLTSEKAEFFLLSLGSLAYLGAVIAGFFWGLGFTVIPATAAIVMISQTANPVLVGLLGGIGAVTSNFLIFTWIKKDRDPDLLYIIRKTHLNSIKKLEKTRLHWLVPLLAGFIIISPLPDEIGDFIFGLYHYSSKKFLALSYILSTIGIFIIASISAV